MTVRIHISGPGQTFSLELLAVKEALEREGIEVEVQDEFPVDPLMTLDQYRELSQKRSEELDALLKTKGHKPWAEPKRKVKIVAEHLPWGG